MTPVGEFCDPFLSLKLCIWLITASAETTEEGWPIGNKLARRNLHEDKQNKELMEHLVSSDAKSQACQ